MRLSYAATTTACFSRNENITSRDESFTKMAHGLKKKDKCPVGMPWLDLRFSTCVRACVFPCTNRPE